ncbi:hypothetical protein OQA88_2028 [Cercophora sp. LCS_1]
MHLPSLLLPLLLTLAAAKPKDPSPISDRKITITHRTITSNRTFAETRAALESAIPLLNNTFSDLLRAGNSAGALEALKALPALNNFSPQPRNFGLLVTIYNITGKNAIQYDIGNPYTASKFVRYDLEGSVYAPIRVSLLEQPAGKVKFVYDRPTTTFGQFDDPRIDVTAKALDYELTQLFLFVGGWESEWPVPALP